MPEMQKKSEGHNAQFGDKLCAKLPHLVIVAVVGFV